MRVRTQARVAIADALEDFLVSYAIGCEQKPNVVIIPVSATPKL
jgi:hypothetical protein